MKRVLSVVIYCSLTAAICTAQSVMYFPQVAEGIQSGGIQWGTIIAITNPAPPGSGNSTGTLNFMKDDGTPWTINWRQYGGQGSLGSTNSFVIQFQLAAGQTAAQIWTPPLRARRRRSLEAGRSKSDHPQQTAQSSVYRVKEPGSLQLQSCGAEGRNSNRFIIPFGKGDNTFPERRFDQLTAQPVSLGRNEPSCRSCL